MGAVLSQVQNGEEKVIAYASKTLKPSQRRYCVTYRELFAVVFFVKQFRHYLLGRRFKIRTDHVSLKWVMRFKDAEAMVGRWVLYLSSFDFEIEHRKGTSHGNADPLSRKVPKRRMACLRELCPECPTGDLSTGKPACMITVAGGLPPNQKRELPSKLDPGCATGELLPGKLAHSAGLVGRNLLKQKREVPSELDQECTVGVLLPGALTCSSGLVWDSPSGMERETPSKSGQESLTGLAWSDAAKPLLLRLKGTLPSDYVCDALSSESEEEGEDCAESNQSIPRAGSESWSVSHEGPEPRVRFCSVDTENGEPGVVCPVRSGEDEDESGALGEAEPEEVDPDDSILDPDVEVQPNWLDTWSLEELHGMQEDDPVIGRVSTWIKDEVGKPDRETLLGYDEYTRALCAQWTYLIVRNGILYRKWAKDEEQGVEPLFQLVTPVKLRSKTFHEVHSSPLGTKRVIAQVRRRFYWPRCKSDLKRWCRECSICAQIKPGPGHKARMKQIPTGCRLDRVHIDVMGELPETDNGNKYILVLTDHFSKWAHAWALPNQLVLTVADAVMTDFFMVFGLPRQIHTDQGPNFESHLFSQMCRMLGIEKTRTTPYRPQSDGHVERYNRTLQQMLKAYVNDNRDDWDDHLPYVMAAYRATRHESTGCTPNKLFLHSENTLPIDLMAGSPPEEEEHWHCPVEYIEWTRQVMVGVHQKVYENLKQSLVRQKRNYDLRSRPTQYTVGQFVWRWYPPLAKRKLGKGWVGPYKVVACPTNLNCVIQRSPESKTVRVHVDHLKLNYGEAPQEWQLEDTEEPDQPESELESEPEQESDLEQEGDLERVPAQDEEPDGPVELVDPLPNPPQLEDPEVDLRRSSWVRRAPTRLDL